MLFRSRPGPGPDLRPLLCRASMESRSGTRPKERPGVRTDPKNRQDNAPPDRQDNAPPANGGPGGPAYPQWTALDAPCESARASGLRVAAGLRTRRSERALAPPPPAARRRPGSHPAPRRPSSGPACTARTTRRVGSPDPHAPPPRPVGAVSGRAGEGRPLRRALARSRSGVTPDKG